MDWIQATRNKKNIIFIGESGCGKTEIALNCACHMAAARPYGKQECVQDPAQRIVTLIDMDQTKSVFRARDFREIMEKQGVSLICGAQFLDTPTVPPGVIHMMESPGFINVIDVGGNETGAVTMGQFAQQVKNTETAACFIINPFRILSLDESHIQNMISRIKNYGRFEDIRFAVNPNLGEHTDSITASEGMRTAAQMAGKLGIELSFTVLPDWLRDDETLYFPEGISEDSIIFIKRYLQYP